MPFLAVRTSAESLSTSSFVLALCLVVLRGETAGPGVAFLAGALLGLSFDLRYVAGVMVVSLIAWMAIVGRTPPRRMAWVAAGAAAALAVGLVVDGWGYGEWVLAPWNYVAANFGRDIAASRFGAVPWYGYATILSRGPFGVLNLLLALAVVVAWVGHPRHVLTWTTAPLTLVHCAIAHKEARFLIPVAMLTAPLLALAIGASPRRRWARWTAGALLAYDLAGLTALCLLPAQPVVPFQRFVSRRSPARRRDPRRLAALALDLARPHDVLLRSAAARLRRWPGASALVAAGAARFDLLVSTWDALPPVEPYECRALYRSVPEWIPRRGWPRGGGTLPVAWDMYRCVRPAPPRS